MSGAAVAALSGAAEAASVLTGLRQRVYAGDAIHRPASEDSTRTDLARPHFRARFLTAAEDGETTAFVAARLSPDLRDGEGKPFGLLGPFESLDVPGAASALLDEAARWLRGEGAGTIIGPISGDTWHSYRVNLGPWDDPPFPLEPHNPPYYGDLWERGAFAPFEGYHSKRVDDVGAVAERLAPKVTGATARGYRFERFRLDRFEDELDRVYAMSCVLFAENPLYVEIPREEFLDLYRAARSLIDPECVRFAVEDHGADAGFVFSVPDSHGVVNVKTLGVLAEHRRAGLGGALTALAYRAAAERGHALNLCLMHDDNPSSRLDGGLGRVLRRYRLYRWTDRPGAAA